MDENDKKELAALFAECLAQKGGCCPLGLTRETASELMDFAASWKKARKTAAAAFIGAVVTSLAASLISGIRNLLGH